MVLLTQAKLSQATKCGWQLLACQVKPSLNQLAGKRFNWLAQTDVGGILNWEKINVRFWHLCLGCSGEVLPLADMYGLANFKTVICSELRIEKFHLFHKVSILLPKCWETGLKPLVLHSIYRTLYSTFPFGKQSASPNDVQELVTCWEEYANCLTVECRKKLGVPWVWKETLQFFEEAVLWATNHLVLRRLFILHSSFWSARLMPGCTAHCHHWKSIWTGGFITFLKLCCF